MEVYAFHMSQLIETVTVTFIAVIIFTFGIEIKGRISFMFTYGAVSPRAVIHASPGTIRNFQEISTIQSAFSAKSH
jgi:hypothetical protein